MDFSEIHGANICLQLFSPSRYSIDTINTDIQEEARRAIASWPQRTQHKNISNLRKINPRWAFNQFIIFIFWRFMHVCVQYEYVCTLFVNTDTCMQQYVTIKKTTVGAGYWVWWHTSLTLHHETGRQISVSSSSRLAWSIQGVSDNQGWKLRGLFFLSKIVETKKQIEWN